jgi:hypothetical protein
MGCLDNALSNLTVFRNILTKSECIMSCGFFSGHSKEKKIAALQQALASSPVSMGVLQTKAEKVFGVKVDKLKSSNVASTMTLLFLTGFNNVYGVTASDESGKLKIKFLDDLRAFMLTESVEEAKKLFMQHASDYISRELKQDSPETETKFNHILPLIKGQFVKVVTPFLYDELKPKKATRDTHIKNLKQVGSSITELLHVMMAMRDGKESVSVGKKRHSRYQARNPLIDFANPLMKTLTVQAQEADLAGKDGVANLMALS